VVHVEDLPPELKSEAPSHLGSPAWEMELERWATLSLTRGGRALLDDAVPRFERIMIETTLRHTGGRRQEAAKLLGWGRNTLTRKIKELGLEGRV
jgi:two-component system nitrogen regulation response regulator GlnG